MIAILDNGHGQDTPGKRSPDGSLLEYEFNRDIVCRMVELLKDTRIQYHILVPELTDVTLTTRCLRANAIAKKNPGSFLISVHANAGGGNGWEAFTSPDQSDSDKIATIFYQEAAKAFPEFRMRTDETDGDPDKEAHFKILTHTMCPAVLTENFFMDHPKDLDFIKSDEGRQRIAQMHVDAIIRWVRLGI